jgi:hypothetical protein
LRPFLSLADGGEPIDEIGDFPARLIVLQAQEAAHETVAFRSGQELGHEAVPRVTAWSQAGETFEKELDADIENAGNMQEAACPYAVDALLVFLDLLKVSPRASASRSWLIPSMIRRALTRPPMCLSMWLGAFFSKPRSCSLMKLALSMPKLKLLVALYRHAILRFKTCLGDARERPQP